MRTLSCLFLALCMLFTLCVQTAFAKEQAEGGPYTVVRVVDGDTIVVQDHDQAALKIRLYGIDCPEGDQPWGDEATQEALLLLSGQQVTLKIFYTDRYGRQVATVLLDDGSPAQAALLAKGLAWVAPRYCKRTECQEWQQMEQAARAGRLGLWADEEQTPPWLWRKRPAVTAQFPLAPARQ